MHDLTDEVARIVNESGVRSGLVHIFNVGSTAAVGAIEFEPGLQEDLPKYIGQTVSAEPGLRPRTRLARWQRPFPFAGDDAGPFAHGANQRSQTRPGRVAANLSS